MTWLVVCIGILFLGEILKLSPIFQPQIGAYYGAEVCVVDLKSNGYMDLLLVAAPLHTQGRHEGKVYVYSVSSWLKVKSQKPSVNKISRFLFCLLTLS